jgi:ribonuclease-3
MEHVKTLTIDEKLESCQRTIGYDFVDFQLLQSALTHASGANRRVDSNERLEFLGDSILGMVVCDHLFRNHPTLLEGELTKIKSNVVSRRTCAKVARRLGLDAYLILGRGMLKSDLPRSLLSDVYEAIIAAIFLDGGLAAAQEFIETTMQDELLLPNQEAGVGNFKSILQHHCQRDLGLTPRYLMLRQAGPDHDKTFAVAAELGTRQFSAACGKSKKDAEQRAAANALAELQGHAPPYGTDECP